MCVYCFLDIKSEKIRRIPLIIFSVEWHHRTPTSKGKTQKYCKHFFHRKDAPHSTDHFSIFYLNFIPNLSQNNQNIVQFFLKTHPKAIQNPSQIHPGIILTPLWLLVNILDGFRLHFGTLLWSIFEPFAIKSTIFENIRVLWGRLERSKVRFFWIFDILFSTSISGSIFNWFLR